MLRYRGVADRVEAHRAATPEQRRGTDKAGESLAGPLVADDRRRGLTHHADGF